MKISLNQLRRELQHELEERTRLYPRLIRENRIHRKRAERKLHRLRQLQLLLNAMTLREYEGIIRRLEELLGDEADKQLRIF